MKTQIFFDERTSTLTYAAFDEASRVGVIIDPVLYFDPTSGRTWTESAMPYFKARFGAKTVIGSAIADVQKVFREVFNLGDTFPTDGCQFALGSRC